MEVCTCQISRELHDTGHLPVPFQREGEESVEVDLKRLLYNDPEQVRKAVLEIATVIEEGKGSRPTAG